MDEQGVFVFAFEYDDTDWVAAHTKEEAIAYYKGLTGVDPEDKDEVDEIKLVEDIDELQFREDEVIERFVTAREIIQQTLAAGGSIPVMLGSTVY